MSDRANAALASELGLCTLSVRYRLAPEHPYPAAEDDVTAAGQWLLDHGSDAFGTSTLFIGGSSAGATLAVRALLRLGPARRRFAGANLIYGVFDLGGTPSQRTQDLSFFAAYLPGVDSEGRRRGDISPLYADLHDMPDALFSVGSDDFVLDDSLFMAMRWRAAGNDAELDVYPGCGHGFDSFPTEMARIADGKIHAWMAKRIGT
jgi:acetyl esterase/lipase